MDRIQKIVSFLKSTKEAHFETKFELVFSFNSQKEADEYYLKVYHWEHHKNMIKAITGSSYLAGFKIKIDLDAKHLSHLTNCYSEIASESGGELFRWKLWA